ncbi:uncharacterized protein MAM_01886 [Metarhizium album ARSEF 1941]|uniref:Uncharacterized protein n=1 Tax=Metarhizium album (strain ARSEF 1941) TaxID=1081103 RepID=A0A0B2X2J6_METAS|nr:uncharacterized protein MAM_01886 [Metarhizium album ARSEF 1941]KHN99962.1 hypothetical protein MAM_01886 [Metarhizium album ARSEF 1941]
MTALKSDKVHGSSYFFDVPPGLRVETRSQSSPPHVVTAWKNIAMAHLSKRPLPDDQPPEFGIWVVVAIIAAIVVVSGVAAALVILVLKYRQPQSYSQLHHIDSQPSSAKLPKIAHDMTPRNVLYSVHEDQRRCMIRKSLADRRVEPLTCLHEEGRRVRPSSRSGNQSCQSHEAGSLVKDWKEFEAALRMDKSRSPMCHPSVMLSTHPPPARRAAEPFAP